MNALGTHLLVELRDCNRGLLNDVGQIEEMMLAAARSARATIVDSRFHRFNPFGISGVVVIAESHLTIHTWPEYGYAAVDIFTCGDTLDPGVAAAYLIESLECKNPSVVELKRGALAWRGEALPHKPGAMEEAVQHERNKELQVVS